MKERKFFRLSGLSKRSRIAIKGRSQVAHSSLLAAVLLGTARRRQRHQHPIGRRTGSMYDSEWFLVNNPLNRYALSTRNALGEECRGSIDLYLQSIRKSSFKPIESDQFQIGPRTSGRFLAKET